MASAQESDPVYEQTITLTEGWNAIYLEVAPEPSDPATVFAGIPVLSVFTPTVHATPAEYIRDLSEEALSDSRWRWWYPDPPKSSITNLFALLANRAYLVHVGDLPAEATEVELTITGRPRVQPIRWEADTYTLTGLPVDPDAPPTFAEFFAASEAHQDAPIYRLDTQNRWQIVNPATETVEPGQAYYIYSARNSAYTGTFELDLGGQQELEYSRLIQAQKMEFRPLVTTSITLNRLSAPQPVPLSYLSFSQEQAGFGWSRMPDEYELPVAAPGDRVALQLGVLRPRFSADVVAQVLKITDGAGTRRLVPVSARIASALPPGTPDTARTRQLREARGAAPETAGLWVGTVELNAVSQPQSDSSVPVPTFKPFSFRLILHVDQSDQARLLKEVLQLWQDGSVDPNDPNAVTPGRAVLLTDDSLISDFSGITLRDGVPVGVRISAPAYDYVGTDLALTGSLRAGNTLTATIVLDRNHPTNPYRHQYHPDHDNLAPDFVTPRDEAYEVTRDITLELDSIDPNDPNAPPELGESLLLGTYQEVLGGLHRNDITVEGRFRLRRVALADVLNQ